MEVSAIQMVQSTWANDENAVYTWANGRRYTGAFVNNYPHGRGLMEHDGKQGVSTYDGEWSKGLMHGEGTMTWHCGSTYQGTWARGESGTVQVGG